MKTKFKVIGPLTSGRGNAIAPTSAEARGPVANSVSVDCRGSVRPPEFTALPGGPQGEKRAAVSTRRAAPPRTKAAGLRGFLTRAAAWRAWRRGDLWTGEPFQIAAVEHRVVNTYGDSHAMISPYDFADVAAYVPTQPAVTRRTR